MEDKFSSADTLKRGLKRPMPPWTLCLVSLVSFGFLAAFVWIVDAPPQPYIAPAFRDPEVARKAALIRPGSALDNNMRRTDVEYRVQAEQGERFSVTYLNSKGNKEHIADAVATEVAVWDANNSEIRAKNGLLLKGWRAHLRVNPGARLFISAKSKQMNSQLKVIIIVDGFYGSVNACEAIAKKKQGFVSCSYKLR